MTTIGILHYFKFNNYYNREFKLLSTVTDYQTRAGSGNYFQTALPINFNPNDQVTTQQVINDENITECDYLLVVNPLNNNIESRWFIIECQRNLKNQWVVTLRRDVLADNWSTVKYAPMMVERAILPNSSPFIFNPEQVSVNQIKQSETLLKDETGCGWIVGYIANGSEGWNEYKEFSVNIEADYRTYTTDDFRSVYLNSLNFNTFYKGTGILKQLRINVTIPVGTIPPSYTLIGTPDELEGETVIHWTYESLGSTGSGYGVRGYTNINNLVSALNSNRPVSWSTISNYHRLYITDIDSYSYSNRSTITSMTNKYLYTINDEKYYKLKVSTQTQNTNYNINTDLADGYLLTYLRNTLSSYMTINYGTYLYIQYGAEASKLEIEEVLSDTYKWKLPAESSRHRLKDAPYYMFCIPYGNVTISINSKTFNFTQVDAMYLAQGIASSLSNSELLDLQLVPYCPLGGFTVSGTTLSFGVVTQPRYTYIYPQNDTSNPKSIIIWAAASSGTKNISFTKSVTNPKMDNITKRYRLCSPNMSGIYEFDAAKNYGLNGFNVDYTYLPYNPYIHITFNRSSGSLYGYHQGDDANDWNDATGLICGGQFSISYNSDAWRNYEINNKNYEASFKRQIQNMDVNHKYDKAESIMNAVTGSLIGSASGAYIGNIVPGIGTAAGAIIGGVTSAVAGAADVAHAEQKFKEAKSYAQDIHDMQLGNIQALPNTLAKITAYTENNKVFPFLEEYDCTDAEKTAIANKIRYNSMTVGVIGTINDYISNTWSYGSITDRGFIKGKVLQLGTGDDYHMFSSIAEELDKGVFLR